MDEPATVGVIEPPCSLDAHEMCLRWIETCVRIEHGAQRTATEELGHQVGDVTLTPVVHGHHVRMVERRRRLGFGLEALQEGGVVGERGVQHLDGDASTQDDIIGEVDGGRGTGADGTEQPVAATEHLTDTVTHPGNCHQRRLLVTRV